MIKNVAIVICVVALGLASCSAPQPLRTREEATAEAVSEAVVASSSASVAASQHQEVMAEAEADAAQILVEGKTTFWKDPQYGCEYIVTPEGSITPRMGGFSSHGSAYHVGCKTQ